MFESFNKIEKTPIFLEHDNFGLWENNKWCHEDRIDTTCVVGYREMVHVLNGM